MLKLIIFLLFFTSMLCGARTVTKKTEKRAHVVGAGAPGSRSQPQHARAGASHGSIVQHKVTSSLKAPPPPHPEQKKLLHNSSIARRNFTSSNGFTMPDINFNCPAKRCKYASMMNHTAFHVVVGTNHDNYFPLFVHRVCDAFQKCIPQRNFRIILHTNSDNDEQKAQYAPAVHFLEKLNIDYTLWVGVFTADDKMLNTFKALQGDRDPKFFVYQTDIDEIPDPTTFNRALKELKSGSCDAIAGRWVDRLAPGGQLNNVLLDLNKTLSDQFPLRCRISNKFSVGFVEKVLMYNSLYRLDGGHHEIWCSPRAHVAQQVEKEVKKKDINRGNISYSSEEYKSLCTSHIKTRKKVNLKNDIFGTIGSVTSPARYCKTIVAIDHFKFVGGIKQYLDTRWRTYKAKGLLWWGDSYRTLVHIERHNQTICTDCPGSRCVDTTGGNHTPIEVDPNKIFYCGVDVKQCQPENKKELQMLEAAIGSPNGTLVW